jgi:hypothetical protein
MKDKICRTCGRKYLFSSHGKGRQGIFYCSRKCYDESRKPKLLKCKICGKEYFYSGGHKNNPNYGSGKIYCSRACCMKDKKPRKSKLPNRICLICNKEYSGYRHGRLYCSNKCKGEAKKNEGNLNWKADKVKYSGLHVWLRRNKPKTPACELCKKENCKLEIHNISGKYKRDINDYIWVCSKCHGITRRKQGKVIE